MQDATDNNHGAGMIAGNNTLEFKIIEGKINKAKYEMEDNESQCFVIINYNLM